VNLRVHFLNVLNAYKKEWEEKVFCVLKGFQGGREQTVRYLGSIGLEKNAGRFSFSSISAGKRNGRVGGPPISAAVAVKVVAAVAAVVVLVEAAAIAVEIIVK